MEITEELKREYILDPNGFRKKYNPLKQDINKLNRETRRVKEMPKAPSKKVVDFSNSVKG